MLTLLTFPSAFGLFSGSPFCVKSALMLQQSGHAWQRSDMLDPRKMPHRKLPVLRTPERLVADSDQIRIWLEQHGADFDPGLNDLQKAQSRALIRMAEEHMYFHIVQDRWGNGKVWPQLRDMFFADVPAMIRKPVANAVRKSVLKGLQTQGIGRFSAPERLDRIERDFETISAFLSQSDFLFGDHPTAADMSVGPMLDAMRATPAETQMTRRIRQDTVLIDYLGRMKQAVPVT
ncbi:MAG: glutathione S-transferase family protein [Pseudomonadota bacterium]